MDQINGVIEAMKIETIICIESISIKLLFQIHFGRQDFRKKTGIRY
jgi:hypothetical protein